MIRWRTYLRSVDRSFCRTAWRRRSQWRAGPEVFKLEPSAVADTCPVYAALH